MPRLRERPTTPTSRPRTRSRWIFVLAVVLGAVWLAGVAAGGGALSIPESLILGLVEGVTEFLPVSSTAHLLVTERIFGMADAAGDRAALDSYAIVVQGGAILAVGLLYRTRLRAMASRRRSADRAVLVAVVLAAAPAAVVGLAAGDVLKERLFAPGPIALAWFVGGVALLILAPRLARRSGAPLELVSSRQALLIGLVQVIALWPGVSRSLVTIAAGVLLGLSLAAAVELSFLLGFVTLLGATGLEALRSGGDMVTTLGWTGPIVGFCAAFVAAALAIRWLVSLVATSGLRPFGVYRITAAAATVVLMVTGVV